MNNWLKLTIAVLLGFLLYGGIYIYALHSDAFKFVEHVIKSSHNIEARVGAVKKVELSLFGVYKEKNVNEDKIVTMPVRVVGTGKTTVVNVEAVRRNGAWKIEGASIDGLPIVLD